MSRVRSGVFSIRLIAIVLGGLLVYGLVGRLSQACEPPSERKKARVDVLFSPDGGCTDRIIEEISQAEEIIRVQMYIFTSPKIADAIVGAQKRGIECIVIADKFMLKARHSKLPVLKQGGVTVLIDAEHKIANNKIMLIDDDTLITGSFNYSKAAEEGNAENVLIIKRHRRLIREYLENFEEHREHSRAY